MIHLRSGVPHVRRQTVRLWEECRRIMEDDPSTDEERCSVYHLSGAVHSSVNVAIRTLHIGTED